MNQIADVGLRLAAEDFGDEDFAQYHSFSTSDEQVIRRLVVHGPVLLRGPRGSGKSAYMLEAHKRIRVKQEVFSAYISLRHFPLLAASASEYMAILIPYVSEQIAKQVCEDGFVPPKSIEVAISTSDFKEGLSDVVAVLNRRIVLMFDDVAHIGRETSLAGFFDFFRTISSSAVSCKASIYPGVTKFGSRFDLYSDATVVDAQRDERSQDFASFFDNVMQIRYAHLLQRVSGSELATSIPLLLGRAVLGNVRAFNALCGELEKHPVITIHVVGDSLKWLASSYLHPALEELQNKLGAYVPVLQIAEKLAEIFFEECGRKKVNTMIVHREHVQRLGKVFEILEYAGFIAKREASRSLTKSASGRGPRYALSLGPLFERTPGVTLSNDLVDVFTRSTVANEDIVEFPLDSTLRTFHCPDPTEEVPLDVLSLPIDRLALCEALPYGLTALMVNALKSAQYNSIEDVVKLSEAELRALPEIGEKKARRIRNAVEQAIWM